MERKVYKGDSLSLEFPYPDEYDDTYSYAVRGASTTTVLTGLTVAATDVLKVEADGGSTSGWKAGKYRICLLYTSPSPRD